MARDGGSWKPRPPGPTEGGPPSRFRVAVVVIAVVGLGLYLVRGVLHERAAEPGSPDASMPVQGPPAPGSGDQAPRAAGSPDAATAPMEAAPVAGLGPGGPVPRTSGAR